MTRLLLLAVALTFCVSQADAFELKALRSRIAVPYQPPVPQKPKPQLATVLKVDLDQGTLTTKEIITQTISVPRTSAYPTKRGLVRGATTQSHQSSKAVERTYKLKGMKIYDAAGFELKPNELKGRLKAGITIAWSKDAKKTSLEHSRHLERGSLIIVDPARKITSAPTAPKQISTAPAIDLPAIRNIGRIRRR